MTSATPAPRTKQQRIEDGDVFVNDILRLCRDKKTRAELRTGLGLPLERCHYLHRYLVPRLAAGQAREVRRAHYAVAALIAARPRTARDADDARAETPAQAGNVPVDWWKRPDLGASLAFAVNKQALKPASAEGDLHLMIRQSADAVHLRLPSLTRHLLNSGAPVDWSVLLDDLARWDWNRDRIATRWLESYFRGRATEDLEATAKEHN